MNFESIQGLIISFKSGNHLNFIIISLDNLFNHFELINRENRGNNMVVIPI